MVKKGFGLMHNLRELHWVGADEMKNLKFFVNPSDYEAMLHEAKMRKDFRDFPAAFLQIGLEPLDYDVSRLLGLEIGGSRDVGQGEIELRWAVRA